MNEFLFRQAIIINGKFRQWHYWGLIDGAFVGIDTGLCSPTEAIKNSQRYTGLTDKNKVRIYEGDIVKVVEDITDTPFDILEKRYGFRTPSEMGRRSIYGREFIAPVVWNNKSTGFSLAYKWADTGQIDDHIRIKTQETEVIGNIYESKFRFGEPPSIDALSKELVDLVIPKRKRGENDREKEGKSS